MGQGGGLFVSGGGSVTVLNSTAYNELIQGGGGGSAGGGAGSAHGGSGGGAQGGGIYLNASTVNILNSTGAANELKVGQGGLDANKFYSPTTAKSATVIADSGTGGTAQGGGLFAAGGSLSLTNDTIAWNSAIAFARYGEQATGAGVNNNSNNTLKLANTIIALDHTYTSSTAPTTPTSNSDLFGTAASSDHDLIGDGTGSNLVNGTNGDQVGTDAAPLNPLFVPATSGSLNVQMPGNYGGFTYTLPLGSNSPALNAGDASTAAGSPVAAIASAEGFSTAADATDQRGFARVINGEIDIGATQSGLLLSGSATASVQAGNDITYTIALSNNGPTSLSSVTLNDAVPANTTFVSLTAPSGWTTSTPAAGGTGTVTATLATLAPDTTATFTLVVQVNAGTTGGTIIANTPNVTYTGSANPVSANLNLSTTVASPATTDITNEVGLLETPIVRDPLAGSGSYIQGALFINESGAAIDGPVALVLNGLPAGVTVTNASGTTASGAPYINIEPPNGVWQPGVRYFLVAVITFSDPTHVKITYTPEVVEGI
jgi:uncharacterized repeat protein (TIGR01451 family)